MTDAALFEQDGELRIRVSYDEAARTLTVSDNGIGMSRDEVVANLGTIGDRSPRVLRGTERVGEGREPQRPARAGRASTSSIIVAARAIVHDQSAGLHDRTRRDRWESDAQGEHTIEVTNKPWRGTDVILHLRDGEDGLLASASSLRAILMA